MSTKIEWTSETWNPLAGCSKVSDGCKNCYAIKDAVRLAANDNPKIAAKYEGTTKANNWTGKINFASEGVLTQPLRWTRPRMIFVNSMSDLFHENVPDEWIDKIFAVMALCPQHTFQVLTKRADRMKEYFNRFGKRFAHPSIFWAKEAVNLGLANHNEDFYYRGAFTNSLCETLSNCWLGVSVENQKAADERIPLLLETPAAVRWLSCEPLIGAVDLWICKDIRNVLGINCLAQIPDASTIWQNKIDWIVCGGESGASPRTCQIEWIRSIVRQCKSASVPVFVKQLGGYVTEGYLRNFYIHKKGGDISEFPEDLKIREFPNGS